MSEMGADSDSDYMEEGIEAGEESGYSSETENLDIPIDPSRTEPGISQILHYEPSMEEAMTQAESRCEETADRTLEEKGEYMTRENQERIREGLPNLEVNVYDEQRGITGRFQPGREEARIEVANKNAPQLTRTTVHETTHFCSNYTERIIPQGRGEHVVYRESGIFTYSYHTNGKGEVWNAETTNRAFNEGLTTLYTDRQLEAMQKEKGELVSMRNGYQAVTDFSREVERIVGEEKLAEAYYGGNISGLASEINRLAEDEKAFEKLSSNLDVIQNTKDLETYCQAAKEIQDILGKMEKHDG